MKKFNGLGFCIIVSVLVLFTGLAQHSTIAGCWSALESEQHVMRATDSLPPSLPAVRETKGRSESRLFIEEFFFSVALCAALLLNQEQYTRHLKKVYRWQPLSKYLTSLIFRQTVR